MKGIMIVWLQVLMGIFIVGMAYTIFSYIIYGQITPTFYSKLEAIDPATSGVNTTAMNATITLINMVWYAWPLIFIFALIIYGIVASQKREYETAFY